ncbi:hypothetical protein FM037_10025 [Shewanella psychropiezotolerans]|uniref:AlgX/AlgJ SGNH hydrolase-like domain-containing protein n=1 Tax=Shewanella psychropiezotolerans TaxID=2593655 RepID=A0ABX5WWR3_9GAMM|nr:hypothetical protein [Shewanella psychropiezotolerans]QDO83513.1 hypothetical protein FM037_10025 [Shewanella psychropiezotolerans]
MNPSSTLNFRYFALFFLRATLVFVLIFSAVNGMLCLLPSDDRVMDKLSLFNEEKDGFTALALGSSHSVGFHFPSLGVKGVNFHDGSGDIEEVVFKAGVILEHAVNINTIFVPVSPGSLHISQRYIANDMLSRRFLIIKNLPLSHEFFSYDPMASIRLWASRIIPVIEVKQRLISWLDLSNFVSKQVMENDKSCLVPVSADVKEDELLLGVYRLKKMVPSCLAEYADSTVVSHKLSVESSVMSDAKLPIRNVERLLVLADRLRLGKVEGRLVLVVPPLTREYYQDDRIQLWIPEHQELLDLLAEHSNIDVYDFHDLFYGEMEDGSNDYFYDDDHLALPGAIKFSKALKKAMNERVR